MRWLVPLLIPLAVYGSGCSLPVGAEENPDHMVTAVATSLPEFVGTDATQAAIALRDAGLQFRLHPSTRGEEGVVLNQVPKAGMAVDPGATVDLVVGGDERLIEMIHIAAQPPTPSSPVKSERDELDAIRARLGDTYTLSEADLAKIEVPSLEGLHHENVPPAPLPEPSVTPKMPARIPDPNDGIPGQPSGLLDEAQQQATVRGPSEPEATVSVGVDAANTAIMIAPDTPLNGPQQVNLGAWTVTLPGPTVPVEREVQGHLVKGAATRTPEGKTIFAGCADITNQQGESLAAGMVDQLLMAAPTRYGNPQRSGRYSSAQMPAVSSIVPTGTGPIRVVTWYGYGQLCDVMVPVDGQGRSDQVLDPILQGIRHN